MKIARISKIAGISFAGFVVATLVADKVDMGPAMAQLAGVAGGLLGTLAARRKSSPAADDETRNPDVEAP